MQKIKIRISSILKKLKDQNSNEFFPSSTQKQGIYTKGFLASIGNRHHFFRMLHLNSFQIYCFIDI